MAIIRHEADLMTTSFYYNEYPDHFVPEKEKMTEKYIKKTLDYFSTIAFQQYNENDERLSANYKLLKGILNKADFYEEATKNMNSETKSFMDDLIQEQDLPQYVKHYPIINPCINALVGELSSRADNIRIKAYDDDSQSEELIAKTKFLQEVITSQINSRISEDLINQGFQEGTPEYDEQLANMSTEQISQYMTSYTSLAEKWANHVLNALKQRFNIKEKSEDAFRDLLITSREFYHVHEDKSKVGFGVKTENPKNVWFLTTPDNKYTKDAYAAGTIDIMEISEIMDKFELSKEEIEYLNSQAKGFYLEGMGVRQSNLLNTKTGEDSFTYDTYDPLVAKYKLFAESKLMAESQLNTFLGMTQAGYATYGSKFVVVQAYFRSKKKIGLLKFYNEKGEPDDMIVDETYKKIPEEISIEWTWIDQWRKGVKIGPHVYIEFQPLRYLDYCPIIGVIHEAKNTPPRSIVDLAKPFQVLYNIGMNQMYQLLKKDLGKVMIASLRYVPKAKDGDYQDAIDQWEMEARERGVMFVDDSPENTKGGGTFAQTGSQDLSRANEIQARYNMCVQVKTECYDLLGFSRERLGGVAASQTATGTEVALSRSFTQTEPWFVQHEYVLQQLYQAIVDTAQWIEGRKPESIINYITNEGENAFIQVNGPDIKLRDYHVYASGSHEDQKLFNDLRQLAQPMMQNGMSAYDISSMFATNSIRQIRDVFRKTKEDMEKARQEQVQLQQQELAQQQEQFQAQMQQQQLDRRETMMNDNYQRELDRINEKEIAIIKTFTLQKDNTKDVDGNGVPDLLEISNLSLDTKIAQQDYNAQISKVAVEREKLQHSRDTEQQKINLEKEKLKVEREKMKNELKIAKYRDKGTKNSPKK